MAQHSTILRIVDEISFPFRSVWIAKSKPIPLDLPIQREQILEKLFRL